MVTGEGKAYFLPVLSSSTGKENLVLCHPVGVSGDKAVMNWDTGHLDFMARVKWDVWLEVAAQFATIVEAQSSIRDGMPMWPFHGLQYSGLPDEYLQTDTVPVTDPPPTKRLRLSAADSSGGGGVAAPVPDLAPPAVMASQTVIAPSTTLAAAPPQTPAPVIVTPPDMAPPGILPPAQPQQVPQHILFAPPTLVQMNCYKFPIMLFVFY